MKIYHLTSRIVENVEVAESLWRLRLAVPEVAATVRPGQFCMVRLPGTKDPLLGRPLAIYNTTSEGEIEVIYAVVGIGTTRLAEQRSGGMLEVWGPLGNGWALGGRGEPVLVAGGIGQTPMYLLAKTFLQENRGKITLLMGSRDAAHCTCGDDFSELSKAYGNRLEIRIATDDGSLGHHGFVTDLLAEMPENIQVFACGPQPMLRRVAEIAHQKNAPCQVSLETPMACGMGICFTCVTKCRADNAEGWDYCRTCVEGPVFDAEKLVWE